MARMPPIGVQWLLHLDACAPAICDWLTLLRGLWQRQRLTHLDPSLRSSALKAVFSLFPISGFTYLSQNLYLLSTMLHLCQPPRSSSNATVWRCHSWRHLLPPAHTHSETFSVFCIQMTCQDSSSSSHLSVLPLRLKAATMSCSESVTK